MKKILSVMLAILMIVTTVPAASFAADAEFLHECTHESVIDGKCESCEKSLKKVVIDMTDSWGDGWSDNKIVIEQLVDGEFEMIAKAFGYPYYCAHTNEEMKKVVEEVLATPGFVFCEIFTDTVQVWEPKSSTKRLEDGTLVSPPLEDLAPFLPKEEMLGNLYIKPVEV